MQGLSCERETILRPNQGKGFDVQPKYETINRVIRNKCQLVVLDFGNESLEQEVIGNTNNLLN